MPIYSLSYTYLGRPYVQVYKSLQTGSFKEEISNTHRLLDKFNSNIMTLCDSSVIYRLNIDHCIKQTLICFFECFPESPSFHSFGDLVDDPVDILKEISPIVPTSF